MSNAEPRDEKDQISVLKNSYDLENRKASESVIIRMLEENDI